MRLVSFEKSGQPAIAVRRGDDLIDLSVVAPDLPTDMNAFLAQGDKAMQAAQKAADGAKDDAVVSGKVTYLPPVPKPGKIFCIGLNYKDHAEENKVDIPDVPVVFARFAESVVGHEQPILKPRVSDQLDYEAELAVVIGKPCRYVSKDKALDYVAGYAVMNEGSVRDYQLRTSQWMMGKTFDKSGAMGPDLVTPDELPEGADGLKIQTRLNGKVMQDSSTAQMAFKCAELIASISETVTLQPGDYIATGTPGGIGLFQDPQIFLKEGDEVEVEIEKIGVLRNAVKNES